eukprot:3126114-Prymnesium_polylepis.2
MRGGRQCGRLRVAAGLTYEAGACSSGRTHPTRSGGFGMRDRTPRATRACSESPFRAQMLEMCPIWARHHHHCVPEVRCRQGGSGKRPGGRTLRRRRTRP